MPKLMERQKFTMIICAGTGEDAPSAGILQECPNCHTAQVTDTDGLTSWFVPHQAKVQESEPVEKTAKQQNLTWKCDSPELANALGSMVKDLVGDNTVRVDGTMVTYFDDIGINTETRLKLQNLTGGVLQVAGAFNKKAISDSEIAKQLDAISPGLGSLWWAANGDNGDMSGYEGDLDNWSDFVSRLPFDQRMQVLQLVSGATEASKVAGVLPHCESCGDTNPDTEDSYTECCNEPVCYGGQKDRYGTPEKNTLACCWAKAREVGVTEGSRLSSKRVAHDSGDGETIYHCPFCGSGQVIGRSDGTAMCDFCDTAFTVQVQPERPSQPQTINGVPTQMPGMPHGGDQPPTDPTADPSQKTPPANPGDKAPNPFGDKKPPSTPPGTPHPQPGDKPGDNSDKPDAQKKNLPPWLKNKASARYYLTSDDVALAEDKYLAHLAIKFAADKQAVIATVKEENERKANNG